MGLAAMTHPSVPLLPVGTTAIRRDTFRGRIWTAYPTRVIEHTAEGLMLAHWPGIEALVPTTYAAWLRVGGAGMRRQAIPNLARGTWELEHWTWHTTTWLHILLPNRWFSVNAVLEDQEQRLRNWYINFQRPHVIRDGYVDTFDLFLDLVVSADGSMRWKDEGEYEDARRLGVVSDEDARAVDRSRQEAVDLIQAQAWPLCEPWTSWRRTPDWPLPVLPADAGKGGQTGAR